MKEEHKIVAQVQAAQKNDQAADDLIVQYLPFIKAETAKFLKCFPMEGQDELNIAMFAFYESILAFEAGKGAFFKFAATAIRNRLIDYVRKEQRHRGLVSLDAPLNQDEDHSLIDEIASDKDQIETFHAQTAAQKEILEFSQQLGSFGLSLSDIADNCPKQERTMSACMAVLDYARKKTELLDQLLQTKKLPMAQLAEGAEVERKTLERHRKYIVAILLAYTNGFEIIRGHLCTLKRKEVSYL